MGWLSKLFTGVDLDEEQARSDALQAQEEAAAKDYAPGGRIYQRIARENGLAAANDAWHQNMANLKAGDQGNVTGQVEDAFTESIKQNPIFQAPLSGLKLGFASIPKEYLLIGAVVLFFYFGGWKILRQKFV